jgi:hypothetical protein
VKGTIVHPSSRSSHRVPFGTGRAVSRSLAGDGEAIAFYRPECFQILGEWLALAEDSFGIADEVVLNDAEQISPLLSEYLEMARFSVSWERISRMKRERDSFVAAFHEWFDGFRTLKLLHHLAATGYTRASAEETLPRLLEMAGYPLFTGVSEALELLREMQQGP